MSDLIKKRLNMVNAIGAITVCAILGTSAAVAVLVFVHGGKDAIAASADLKKNLNDVESLGQSLPDYEKSIQSLNQDLAKSEALLPRRSDLDKFSEEIAKVAKTAGLNVESQSTAKEPKDVGNYKSQSITLSGTGDWNSCYQFLVGLRGMQRLNRLDSVQIESDRDHINYDKPNCRITVTISTFMAG